MRNAIAQCVEQKAAQNSEFMLITGDAGLGVWDNYQKDFSAQYVNPGINEALCVGMAAGLALCGKKVVYYNIAPFVIMRPYEQVRNDICYQELPVILVGTGSGLTYMPSGMTHYAIEDIALALSLPNLNIFSPSDSIQARSCFEYAYNDNKPSYIRIPKAGEPNLIESSASLDITAPQILYQSNNHHIALITHSSIAALVLEVGKKQDISVISCPFINAPNERIIELMAQYERVIVIEEHYKYGGLGTYLMQKSKRMIEILALENAFIHLIGNQDYGREQFGLSIQGIEQFIACPPPCKSYKDYL